MYSRYLGIVGSGGIATGKPAGIVVTNGTIEKTRFLDFKNFNYLKLCVSADWGTTVSATTGATLQLIQGIFPGEDSPDSPLNPANILWETAPTLPIINLNPEITNFPISTHKGSFTIYDLLSSNYSRFLQLQFGNLDGTYPVTTVAYLETAGGR